MYVVLMDFLYQGILAPVGWAAVNSMYYLFNAPWNLTGEYSSWEFWNYIFIKVNMKVNHVVRGFTNKIMIAS